MVIFGFLVVCAILTFQPLQLTSLLLDQHRVSSLDTQPITNGTATLIYNPTGFSSPAMWCLMKPRSRFLRSLPLLLKPILSFSQITLTLYRLP